MLVVHSLMSPLQGSPHRYGHCFSMLLYHRLFTLPNGIHLQYKIQLLTFKKKSFFIGCFYKDNYGVEIFIMISGTDIILIVEIAILDNTFPVLLKTYVGM